MAKRLTSTILALSISASIPACVRQHSKVPAAEGELGLSTIVLYRNGVGYFERRGTVKDGQLRLRVRRDHLNDLLKSLTVVDSQGQVLSVSMPLESRAWADVAGSALGPDSQGLAQALSSLRGTKVRMETTAGRRNGRVTMVEPVEIDVHPESGEAQATRLRPDHRVTLLDGDKLTMVLISQIEKIELADGDIALSLQRALDASSGEGMFQLVDVNVRLDGTRARDVLVSYVVEAPVWKPTYRVVLPDESNKNSLLQGWAVVDNISGEDWTQVDLSLAAGAPIAFQYDMHSPQRIERQDLSYAGQRRRARVALGDTRMQSAVEEDSANEVDAADAAMMDEIAEEEAAFEDGDGDSRKKRRMGAGGISAKSAQPQSAPSGPSPSAPPMSLSVESVFSSAERSSQAQRVAGLTRIDLHKPVSVPQGTSTMVAFINEGVEGEDAFLYKRGGSGPGYEHNPYRVLRFVNRTPFALEPGPISIYAGGSFVGEGFTDAIGSGSSATIPYAVEQGIEVESTTEFEQAPMRVVRISGGVLEVERFSRRKTKWSVRGFSKDGPTMLYVEQARAGGMFELMTPKAERKGVEIFPDYYRLPIALKDGASKAELEVVEETPSKFTVSIWDGQAEALFDTIFATSELDSEARKKLEPIVTLRREIGRIDTRIRGLKDQQRELSARAQESRQNLEALKKDPKAGALRKRISNQLESFTNDADRIGREIVSLSSERLEKKLALEELLQGLDLRLSGKHK